MSWVAGVDGCRGGWFMARWDGCHVWEGRLFATFAEILEEKPFRICAVDIPIGLPETVRSGGRACDRAARERLGSPRSSSVFSPPARPALRALTHAQANALNGAVGLSIQAFNLLPKIREVDAVITPEWQKSVFEAHPEVSFMAAAGHPMRWKKRKREGRRERLAVLARVAPGFGGFFERMRKAHRRRDVALDDIIDAGILCWTARRIVKGRCGTLPGREPVERDARGLVMAITF